MDSPSQSRNIGAPQPDRLSGVLQGGRARHTILSRPVASSETQHWSSEGVFVDRGRYAFGVAIEAGFRPGFLCIGYASGPRRGVSVDGLEVPEGHLQAYTEGCEILYRAAPTTTWTSFQVRRESLEQRAEARFGRSLEELPRRSWANLAVPPGFIPSWKRVLDSVLAEDLEQTEERDDRAVLEQVLVDALVDGLDACSRWSDPRGRQAAARRRTALVQRARRLLVDERDGPYDSAAVCASLGVPERTLQHAFREVLGVSPRAWSRLARLHRARQLLSLGGAAGGVTDVALRCGFDQLGRFSVQYRQLFGERPSETLGRA